jgi:hypothetical protein
MTAFLFTSAVEVLVGVISVLAMAAGMTWSTVRHRPN